MAQRFRRTRHGVQARLDDAERHLLGQVFDEVAELLAVESTTSATTMDDAAALPSRDPSGDRSSSAASTDDALGSDRLAALVGIGSATSPPSDPALARLLPDAHREDPAASAEFRRYTELGLRERKRDNLRRARATLDRPGSFPLTDEEATAWLVALTDVRLVIGTRLGLREDEDHERLLAWLAAANAAEADHTGSAHWTAGADDAGADDAGQGDATADAARSATPDTGFPADTSGPRRRIEVLLNVYNVLGWLQETLVDALEPAEPGA
ncbi:MAG: DUF2017 domain-containing protein [Angustibacter sp.]